MSVANLTRYTVFHNEYCDWNCGLMPQHDGNLVKFEEAVEASSNSLQQLKAEIAAIADSMESDNGAVRVVEWWDVINKLRQLSAV